jgi:hypothetical protein
MTRADDSRTISDLDKTGENPDQHDRAVTVHECSPTRTVFTETGNSDGWIATDTTVDLQR